jgi:penicillin-insensitive murein endopeptidase
LGRTYLHSAVHAVVLDAYGSLVASLPSRVFVYGETGFVRGGEFSPHRTHQNGLSVDFMVPIIDSDGQPAELPTTIANRYGYDIDFDRHGKADDLSIDFDAMAAHLLALAESAQARKVPIARVIFAPDLQPHLRRTALWARIRDLPFSSRPSWVRHDDHYHVDFAAPCQPLESSERRHGSTLHLRRGPERLGAVEHAPITLREIAP